MTTYTNRNDAIHNEITLALGDYADQHNIDAIADAVLEAQETDKGYVFFLNEDVDFWEIVEANAL